MKVRIGFGLGTTSEFDTSFADAVDALEDSGFDSLWLSERLTGPAVDPLIGLAFAAGRTTNLKFGTSVMVLPGRNPIVVAKQIASLDVLSGGRMLPAFGLGVANPAEQQAFGVERSQRAAWFEEALPLIRRLWSEDSVDHHGPRFDYEGVRVLPKPANPALDVWLGGRAPAELRRVGRLADGWLPSFCLPGDARADRVVVEEAAAAAGRSIDPEHWGVLLPYAVGELPERYVTRMSSVAARRDPREITPVGIDALRRRLEEFVAEGFSKLVLLPVEPVTATDIATLGAAILDLQRTVTRAA